MVPPHVGAYSSGVGVEVTRLCSLHAHGFNKHVRAEILDSRYLVCYQAVALRRVGRAKLRLSLISSAVSGLQPRINTLTDLEWDTTLNDELLNKPFGVR
jgi:hypothetical protein